MSSSELDYPINNTFNVKPGQPQLHARFLFVNKTWLAALPINKTRLVTFITITHLNLDALYSLQGNRPQVAAHPIVLGPLTLLWCMWCPRCSISTSAGSVRASLAGRAAAEINLHCEPLSARLRGDSSLETRRGEIPRTSARKSHRCVSSLCSLREDQPSDPAARSHH